MTNITKITKAVYTSSTGRFFLISYELLFSKERLECHNINLKHPLDLFQGCVVVVVKNLSKFYFSVTREQMRGTAVVFFPGNDAGYLKHVIVSVEYVLSNHTCDLFVTFDIFRNLIEIMSGISEYFFSCRNVTEMER